VAAVRFAAMTDKWGGAQLALSRVLACYTFEPEQGNGFRSHHRAELHRDIGSLA
jgi:hypothetical protein